MHLLQNQNAQHHLRHLPRPAPIRVETLIQRRKIEPAQQGSNKSPVFRSRRLSTPKPQ
jgi:hypothetical protein